MLLCAGNSKFGDVEEENAFLSWQVSILENEKKQVKAEAGNSRGIAPASGSRGGMRGGFQGASTRGGRGNNGSNSRYSGRPTSNPKNQSSNGLFQLIFTSAASVATPKVDRAVVCLPAGDAVKIFAEDPSVVATNTALPLPNPSEVYTTAAVPEKSEEEKVEPQIDYELQAKLYLLGIGPKPDFEDLVDPVLEKMLEGKKGIGRSRWADGGDLFESSKQSAQKKPTGAWNL